MYLFNFFSLEDCKHNILSKELFGIKDITKVEKNKFIVNSGMIGYHITYIYLGILKQIGDELGVYNQHKNFSFVKRSKNFCRLM